jgi:hypothetical protein
MLGEQQTRDRGDDKAATKRHRSAWALVEKRPAVSGGAKIAQV